MSTARTASTALLAAFALAAAITGCRGGLLPTSSAAQRAKSCTAQHNALPSALTILIHRDSASSRAELNAILLTASPDEYIYVFNAVTGKLLGSFKTPPGPRQRGPIPPAPLPADPTELQTYTYSQEVARYDAELRREQTLLHRRWLARLTVWASAVMSEALPERATGPSLSSEVPGLVRGLGAASASISSLDHIPGIHLGGRIVLGILGLQRVPTATPPQLPGGWQDVTVVVAGFNGTSKQEITWRAAFTHAGARETVVLTPSTSDELPAVVEPVLDRGDQPSSEDPEDSC